MWFWLHDAHIDSSSAFNFKRDDIYLAVVLFGVGGTTISVVALTFLSSLVGEYSVSLGVGTTMPTTCTEVCRLGRVGDPCCGQL